VQFYHALLATSMLSHFPRRFRFLHSAMSFSFCLGAEGTAPSCNSEGMSISTPEEFHCCTRFWREVKSCSQFFSFRLVTEIWGEFLKEGDGSLTLNTHLHHWQIHNILSITHSRSAVLRISIMAQRAILYLELKISLWSAAEQPVTTGLRYSH
jgi:hypothetical protein